MKCESYMAVAGFLAWEVPYASGATLKKKMKEAYFFYFWFFLFCFVFLPFLGLLPRHMEVPRLGGESEL